jgi:hypothetical protein
MNNPAPEMAPDMDPAEARPDAPSAQDFFATFIMPPTPGEIAQFAWRKASDGRYYFAYIFGQGGQGVKVWRRDLDGSVAFLGRAWPVAGYNVAGFDMLLDPPFVWIGFPGHDLHAIDPTQRNNGVMWVAIPCGVAPGDPATAVPQEWGANIPQQAAPPPPPQPAPAGDALTLAQLITALGHDHDLRDALGHLMLDTVAAGLVAAFAADGAFYQGAGPYRRVDDGVWETNLKFMDPKPGVRALERAEQPEDLEAQYKALRASMAALLAPPAEPEPAPAPPQS